MVFRYVLLSIFFYSLITTTQTFADTDIGDTNISNRTLTLNLAGSPWHIINDLTIAPTGTLRIDPGVELVFDGAYTLDVQGTLIARGSDAGAGRIIIRNNPGGPAWKCIKFSSSSFGTTVDGNNNYLSGSIFEHVTITGAGSETCPNTGYNVAVFLSLLNALPPHFLSITLDSNAGGGIFAQNMGSDFMLRDSVISNNNTDLSAPSGGVSLNSLPGKNSRAVIENNRFLNNGTSQSGGGVFLNGFASASFTGNTFEGNNAQTGGGGLFINGLVAGKDSNLILNNTFQANRTASEGGGLYVNDAHVSIENNRIVQNNASKGGGMVYHPKALPADGTTVYELTLKGNIFLKNFAAAMAGAAHFNHGAGFTTDLQILNNYMIDNIVDSSQSPNPGADHAGALDFHSGNVRFENNIVSNNRSTDAGGALRNTDEVGDTGIDIFTNNVFIANTSSSVFYLYTATQFNGNTVVRNQPTPYLFNLSGSSFEITGNNIVNNVKTGVNPIVIAYSGNSIINATGNWWGTTVMDEINSKFPRPDLIDITGYTDTPLTGISLSPPANFSVVGNGNEIQLSWDANGEADVAGYNLYWSDTDSIDFNGPQDIGNATSTTLTTDAAGVRYYAITAYDDLYGTVADDPATVINEKQISGNESWYSKIVAVSVVGADVGLSPGTVPQFVHQGSPFEFSITAKNKGPNAASSVFITLTPAAGLTINTVEAGCTRAEDTGIITCNHSTLLPGNIDGTTLTFTGTPAMETTEVSLTATVSALEDDFNTDDNTLTLTVESLPPDQDGDGVSDAIENAGPNGGDNNLDGVNDSTQSNVVSLRTGDTYITLVYPETLAGSNLKVIEPTPGGLPEHVTALSGMLSFQVTAAAGTCGDVTVFLSKNSLINGFYVYEESTEGAANWRALNTDDASEAQVVQEAKATRIILSLCVPAAAEGESSEQTLTLKGIAVNDDQQALVQETTKKKKKKKWYLGAVDPVMMVFILALLLGIRGFRRLGIKYHAVAAMRSFHGA